jgi:hypothetical protein
MADEPAKLPWNADESAEWRATVNGWPWRSSGGGDWAKSGTCPRCDHGITVLKEGGVDAAIVISEESRLALLVRAEDGPLVTETDPSQFFARCDCGEEHPGRPTELSRGCGRWAYIDPPEDEQR